MMLYFAKIYQFLIFFYDFEYVKVRFYLLTFLLRYITNKYPHTTGVGKIRCLYEREV